MRRLRTVPQGRYLRGVNIAPHARHYVYDISVNGRAEYHNLYAEWDWDGWIKPLIDAGADLGANALRFMGTTGVVTLGTLTRTQYLDRIAELADYCAGLDLLVYPCLTMPESTAGASVSAIAAEMVAAARLWNRYSNVVGIDVLNEATQWLSADRMQPYAAITQSTLTANVATFTTAIREVTTIPLACSYGADDTHDLWDTGYWDDIGPLVDLIDVHLYCEPERHQFAYLETFDKPIVHGEFGAATDIPVEDRVALYDNTGSFVGDPSAGAFAWAVADATAGPGPSQYQFGLFDAYTTTPWTKRPGTPEAFSRLAAGTEDPSTLVSYGQQVISDGALAYWPLTETTGDAVDQVGALALPPGGTFTSRGSVVLRSKVSAGGCEFSAAGLSRLIASGQTALNFAGGTAFSVELWFRPTVTATPGNFRRLIYRGLTDGSGRQEWTIVQAQTTGRISFELWRDGASFSVAQTATPLVVGTTYHVVADFDGDRTRLYLNDQLAAVSTNSAANTLKAVTGAIAIGVGSASGTSAVDGTISDVAVYSPPLSAAQRASHYQLGQGVGINAQRGTCYERNRGMSVMALEIYVGRELPTWDLWCVNRQTGETIDLSGATFAVMVRQNETDTAVSGTVTANASPSGNGVGATDVATVNVAPASGSLSTLTPGKATVVLVATTDGLDQEFHFPAVVKT